MSIDNQKENALSDNVENASSDKKTEEKGVLKKIIEGLIKKGSGLNKDALKADVIKALCQVFDPEIPVNIYDLGLIYDVEIDDEANVDVKMTLTTPGCPVAQTFPGTVERAVNEVEGVNDCIVELVWDPPWTQERMTEAAKLELGLFY